MHSNSTSTKGPPLRHFAVASTLLFSFHTSLCFGHQGTTEFGDLEAISANDYHFHLPMSVGMDGKISFGIEGLTHEHEHADESASHESTAHVEIVPMLLFNWEKVERNICADKVTLNPSDLNVPLAENCERIWNLQKRQLNIGAGLSAHIGFGGIGIVPTKDTQIFQKRAVLSNQIPEVRPDFPEEVNDFSYWSIGDQIKYQKTLGLMLHSHVELPLPILKIGPTGMFSSTWLISLEKTTATAVHVQVETSKMSDVGAEMGMALANLGINFSWNKSVTFHFVINTNENGANEAFQTLLAGKIGEAIRLSETSKAILNLGNDHGKARVRSFVVAAGVPVLFGAQSSRGTMKAVSIDDHEHKMSSTLVFRERTTGGLLSRHKISGEYLAGSVEALQEDDFGHFGFVGFWVFEKEKMNDTRLARKVNGFIRDLGLYKTKISLPNDSNGYLRGETKVSFSSASLKAFVNMIQSKKEMEIFLAKSDLEQDAKTMWLRRWTKISSKLRKIRKTGDTLSYSQQLTLLARQLIDESTLFRLWVKSTGGITISVRVLGEKIPEASFEAEALQLL